MIGDRKRYRVFLEYPGGVDVFVNVDLVLREEDPAITHERVVAAAVETLESLWKGEYSQVVVMRRDEDGGLLDVGSAL